MWTKHYSLCQEHVNCLECLVCPWLCTQLHKNFPRNYNIIIILFLQSTITFPLKEVISPLNSSGTIGCLECGEYILCVHLSCFLELWQDPVYYLMTNKQWNHNIIILCCILIKLVYTKNLHLIYSRTNTSVKGWQNEINPISLCTSSQHRVSQRGQRQM